MAPHPIARGDSRARCAPAILLAADAAGVRNAGAALARDQRAARRVLRSVLSQMDDLVFEEAATLDEALRLVREQRFDVYLVNLDPTAGLDPAVREITQTRLMAERAMFTMQRMPFLLRLQTELLTYQLSDQSPIRQALADTTLLAGSADRISN